MPTLLVEILYNPYHRKKGLVRGKLERGKLEALVVYPTFRRYLNKIYSDKNE